VLNALFLQTFWLIFNSNRYPNSKSEDTTSYHTPVANIYQTKHKRKYNFHIPAHLRSKGKDFLSNNIDGSKYNLEVLSNGKYSVKENKGKKSNKHYILDHS
jgi:hypothetical protein